MGCVGSAGCHCEIRVIKLLQRVSLGNTDPSVCHAPVYLAAEGWVPEWVKHELILSETHVLMMYVYAELSILNRDIDRQATKGLQLWNVISNSIFSALSSKA